MGRGKLFLLLILTACRLWAGYVTDGLILHFDAIDNAGVGVHSDNPSVWKDLSVSGCDLTLPASGVTVGADSIMLAKTVATLTGVPDLANAALTNFTVEVLARTDESFVPKTNNRQLIYNNRFGITFRDLASGKGFIVANIFNPRYNGVYWYRVAPRCTDWNNLPFARNFHTYSLRVTESSGASRIAIDSGLYQTLGGDFTSAGGKSLNDTLTLGSTDCNFIYQSIRIYNRHLTEAEMRQNFAEDAVRYPKAVIADPHATTNVFADALYWFNGARGTGETVYTKSNTVANVLWAGTAECPDGDRYGEVKGATSNLVVETTDVVCPYMRRTLKNRRTLHFRQCCWTNENNVVRASTATYRQNVNGNFTNGAPYSVVVRFKVDSFMAPNNYADLLFLGYAWTNESGLWWRLRGPEDNMWVQALHGSNADPFTDMTNKPAYRLSCGKWVDMALVVEEGTRNRLYYRTEDGELYEGTRNDAIVRSKDNRSYEFVLGSSGSNGYNGTTGADASSLYSFRGWFDQLAIWGRALSRDEVLQAFRGGCDDYDACRVGVPNGGNGEFGGTGDADLNDHQAWINMTNALPAAGSSVKVRFDLPADRVQFARTFCFTSTPFSQDGATIRVRLNGNSIAEGLSVAAGMTAVADVPAGSFVPSGNVLEITRTDEGAKTLEIDCLAITAAIGDAADPVGAAIVEDDVYSDAYCWYRWPEDDDGNGYLLSGSTNATSELRDALRAGNPRQDAHLWYRHAYSSYSNFIVAAESVTCPARGVTLTDEPCLRLQYPTWTNGNGEVVGSWGGLQRGHNIFAVSNATGYSALARIKLDGYMAPSSDHAQVMGTGYDWGNKRGACLHLYGETNNMYVTINCGYSNLDFKDTQTGAAANRLQTGKWIDIGYTVSNGWFRLYTFIEGGELVEQIQNGGSGALGEPGASSGLFIGSSSGGGANKATSGLYGFNGLFHQVAVWPRMLTKEEMLKAMGWPKPDLVRLGTANGSALEFTGGVNPFTADSSAFRTASSGVDASGNAYVVEFDVPAEEASLNQQLSVAATAASVSEAVFAIELNGERVQNFDDTTGVLHTELSVPAGTRATFGVHRSYLSAGRNTLRLVRTDGQAGMFELDALALGNGGRRVRVVKKPSFIVNFR